jgi:hypothetical protein
VSRCRSLLLVLVLAVPTFAAAQESPTLPRARVSVTPFTGYRIGFTTSGRLTLSAGPDSVSGAFDEERGGGTVVGAQLEIRAVGPVNLIGAVSYGRAGEIRITDPSTPQAGAERVSAPSVWLAKAGLAFRLPDPVPDSRSFHPAAFVTVAPAVVREEFVPGFAGQDAKPVNHFALSLGADVVTAIGAPWIALHIGVEDFITFWNTDERERRTEEFLFRQLQVPVNAEYTYDPSHIPLLRAGVSFRF